MHPLLRGFAVPFPLGMWGVAEAGLREAMDGADLFLMGSQLTTAAVPIPALLEYCWIPAHAHLPALQEQPQTVSRSGGGWHPTTPMDTPPPPWTQGGSTAPSPSQDVGVGQCPDRHPGTVQGDKELRAIGPCRARGRMPWVPHAAWPRGDQFGYSGWVLPLRLVPVGLLRGNIARGICHWVLPVTSEQEPECFPQPLLPRHR